MSLEDYVLSRIAVVRPRAKFVKYSHSSDFIDEAANLGQGFHYVNLYDEQIDSNVIRTTRGLVMVANTYLPSFAYNLFLCWLYGHGTAAGSDAARRKIVLDGLLAHNFKKFFAEQLLHMHNDIASRALLLETLLFEQTCMIPVFAEKAKDEVLADSADRCEQVMSSVLSFHELGHYMFATKPGAWESILDAERDVLASLFEQACERYPMSFVEELKCDAAAVFSCIQQYKDRGGMEFVLRALVFSFAAYAVLMSLTRSARATAETRQTEPPEIVDLKNLEKLHREHDIRLGIDRDFVERMTLVTAICRRIAEKNAIALIGTDGPFPLQETIADDLLKYVDRVLDCDDANARAMSSLVSEALHGHEEGMEYLYLRSKTFKTNRPGPLRV